MPEDSEIVKLILKSLNGELTSTEQEKLDKWQRESKENRELLQRRLSLEGITKKLKILSDKDGPAIKARFSALRKISFIPNRLSLVLIYLAAAAVAGVIATAGYMWVHHGSHSTDIARNDKRVLHNDAAPGGNKAILTLANGNQIVLDSVQNGVVSNQGGTNVIKSDNGKLAYTASPYTMPLTYNTLTTPRAGQFQVLLPDGTIVFLNNASSLKYPTNFAGQPNRTVQLQGEAFFAVAKDRSSPFKVMVKGVEVDVLGTSFNILAYNDEPNIQTTLLDGAVKVNHQNKTVLLKPGEQASLDERSEKISVRPVNARNVLAWKRGFFYFDNADLKTVMRQLSRWYDVQIVYEGDVPNRNFDGGIDRSLNLSQVLKIMKSNQVHYRLEDKKLVLTP